jgi:hypothetical protein
MTLDFDNARTDIKSIDLFDTSVATVQIVRWTDHDGLAHMASPDSYQSADTFCETLCSSQPAPRTCVLYHLVIDRDATMHLIRVMQYECRI